MFIKLFSDWQDSNCIWFPQLNNIMILIYSYLGIYRNTGHYFFTIFKLLPLPSPFYNPYICLLKFSNNPLPISILAYELASFLI